MAQTKQPNWKGKSRGGSLGHLCFVITIKHLGVRAAYTLLYFVVPYFIPFAPKSTKAIWNYNRTILNYNHLKSFFKLLVHYYRFGQTIIDKVAIANGLQNRYKFDFENYPQFIELLNSGKGLIMIGAHVGNWEIGGPFFGDYGSKLNIVMFNAEYQKIKDILERSTSTKNYKIIPLNEDGIDSILKIKGALDNKEYVCFQGDRFMNDNNKMLQRFMGQDAYFPSGPYLLASRLNVPVVFYFSTRERGLRYKFHFTLAEPIVKNKTEKPENQLLNQYTVQLEEIVKKYPQQWFNFYKFWH